MQEASGQQTPAAVQARPAAEGMATTGLPDISVLLEQAMAASRPEEARSEQARPTAEGMATTDHPDISVLLEEAPVASRREVAKSEHTALVAADVGRGCWWGDGTGPIRWGQGGTRA